MPTHFLSRPKDPSLQAYKDWIMSIATRFNAEARDNLSEQEWIERWEAFWSKPGRESDEDRADTPS